MHIHKTGGGPKPPDLSRVEEAISRIFSKTPAFSGIVTKEKADSKIILKRGPTNNDQIGRACGAQMVAEASNLQKSVNSGTYLLNCHTAICTQVNHSGKASYDKFFVCRSDYQCRKHGGEAEGTA